jgi:phosphoglucosamine mutase
MADSRKYFGTDGVRGPYGGPVINENFAARLGLAAGQWLAAQPGVSKSQKILVGRDTRASGAGLLKAVAAGLAAAKWQVVDLGVVPTPAVSLAVRAHRAALGVMITASHNPAGDNGIKFFGPAGMKLTDAQEAAIEAALPTRSRPLRPANLWSLDARDGYMAILRASLPANSLTGWKIVTDTANGATAGTTPALLREFGADVIGIGDAPDGSNINAGVGSEHPEALCAAVPGHGARLGIAHDGDGDRCILCDERGEVLDGDEILTILALHALKSGQLAKNTLVVTVQSNLGVDAAVSAAGGRVLRSNVGDRYVIEKMLAEGAQLGGESSGHIICADISPTGDGLLAALKVIGVMLASGQPLSQMRRQLRKFPQQTAALKVREKKPLETCAALQAEMRGLESELGAQGRLLVRYSGTEAKLRLLIEGPTDEITSAGLARLVRAASADLEVLA